MGKSVTSTPKGVKLRGQVGVRGNYSVAWVGDPRGTVRDSNLSLKDYVTDQSAEAAKCTGSWIVLQRKGKAV